MPHSQIFICQLTSTQFHYLFMQSSKITLISHSKVHSGSIGTFFIKLPTPFDAIYHFNLVYVSLLSPAIHTYTHKHTLNMHTLTFSKKEEKGKKKTTKRKIASTFSIWDDLTSTIRHQNHIQTQAFVLRMTVYFFFLLRLFSIYIIGLYFTNR